MGDAAEVLPEPPQRRLVRVDGWAASALFPSPAAARKWLERSGIQTYRLEGHDDRTRFVDLNEIERRMVVAVTKRAAPRQEPPRMTRDAAVQAMADDALRGR